MLGRSSHNLKLRYLVGQLLREIIVCDINYPVTEVKWTMSQSNRDDRTITLLNKKCCAPINDYNF